MGTLWRDLSKPPQMRPGHDPCPLRLLVGTPSALGPELASRLAAYSGGCLYIQVENATCELTVLICVKDLNGSKTIKDSFNVFVFCLLEKQCLQISTICLQVNFIKLISFNDDFMKKDRSINKIYETKIILNLMLLEYEISIFRKVCPGQVIFSRTQIKLTLFWRVYILRP